jgi:hypothetical protein
MSIKIKLAICTLFFATALWQPGSALAIANLALTASGESGFVLQGTGIENTAAIDITITYDASSLANPKVVAGPLISGSLTAVNPNQPGTIRMAVIRTTPISGSGVIATITFERKTDLPGKISSFSVRLANLDGKAIPAVVQVVNPSDTPVTATNPPTNQTTSPPVIAANPPTDQAASTTTPKNVSTGSPSNINPPLTVIPVGPGIVLNKEPGAQEPVKGTGNSEGTVRKDQTDLVAPGSQDKVAAKTVPASDNREIPESVKTPAKKVYTQTSVIERFRDYKGESSPKKLISLFTQDEMIGFRQDPRIAFLADKARVKVIFISPENKIVPSDIAVAGARLVSVKRDVDSTNTWIAEMELIKGELSASLTIIQDNLIMIYPLTIAIKADIALSKRGAVTEEDFKLFLKDRGTLKSPKYDLNGDGKRDYLDDYIFTANYIVARQNEQAGKKKIEKDSAEPARRM